MSRVSGHRLGVRKNIFCIVFCILVVATCVRTPVSAQLKKVTRLGYLSGVTIENDKPLVTALRQKLRELGYTEEKDIIIEERYAAGRSDKLTEAAKELINLKVDIFVVSGGVAVQTLKNITNTIPIVMANASDPVGAGVVASLAHPGGNITGLSDYHFATITKRLELLKEVVPSTSRVSVMFNPANASNPLQLKDLQKTAPSLKVSLAPLETQAPADIDRAFVALKKDRPSALLLVGDPLLSANQKRIAEFALVNRIPSGYTLRQFVEAGGLMSYGTNFADMWRRAATYVDKILKGTKPADLPVEQPTKFELMINLKTAKQIGLTIPPNVLVRADKVIK
jgi:putative ABC transport system substrate-binding protein